MDKRGLLLSLAGSFCAAVYFIPYKAVIQTVRADIFVLGLFFISFIIHLFPVFFKSSVFKLNRTTIWGGFIFAGLAVLGNYFCGKSLAGLNTSLTVVILRTQVLAVMAAGLLFFKEKVDKYLWIGSGLALLGIILSSLLDSGWQVTRWLSILWAFSSMLCFALIHVLVKSIINFCHPVSLNIVRMFFAFLIIAVIPGRLNSLFTLSVYEWLMIFFSALFGPFLSRIAYIYALKYMPLSRFILITMLTPVFALVLSLLLLNDTPTIFEVIGGCFVLTGTSLPFLVNILKNSRSGSTSKHD